MIFKPEFSWYSSSIGHFFNTVVHSLVSTLISKAPCFFPNTLQVAYHLGILIRIVKWLSHWPELVKVIEAWPPMFQPAVFHAALDILLDGSSIFPVVWLWTWELFVPALSLYHSVSVLPVISPCCVFNHISSNWPCCPTSTVISTDIIRSSPFAGAGVLNLLDATTL